MLPDRRASYSPPGNGFVPSRRSPLREVSAIDSPLMSSSDEFRSTAGEKDFFSQIVPEPSHPNSMRRALASAVVFLFIVCIVWTAIVEPEYDTAAPDYERGLAWAYGPLPVKGAFRQSPAQKPETYETEAADNRFDAARTEEVAGKVESGSVSAYQWHGALQVPEGTARIIIIGDLHGKNDSAMQLFDRLGLTDNDLLLHAGDLVSKSPLPNSLSTVALMRNFRAKGVRGNHDDGVIRWREWMRAYGPLSLAAVTQSIADVGESESTIEPIIDDDEGKRSVSERQESALTGPEWDWLDLPSGSLADIGVSVPKGWDWHGSWFEIARQMSEDDYEYLKSAPLTLRIDHLSTYLVHAGMLPWLDMPTTSNQDVAGVSTLTSKSLNSFTPLDGTELTSPLLSLLVEEHNADPETLLTMRMLDERGGSVKVTSKGKKGTPWYERWNEKMSEAARADRAVQVVYGHWAGKGLTINDYSIGLDSGCVYGKSLSALVIPVDQNDPESPLSSVAGTLRKLEPGWSSPLMPPEDAFSPPSFLQRSELLERADDDAFSEQSVTFAGRKGWVVSMKCSS